MTNTSKLRATPETDSICGRGGYFLSEREAELAEHAEGLERQRDELAEKKNILRNVSSEWRTTMADNQVTCHDRMVEGVLCRWWGDGPTPPGVAVIDNALLAKIEGERK